MTFTERQAGQPEALRAWFYPGRSWGEEFVYPKAKAVELAKAANPPVLFTPEAIPVEVAEPIRSVDAPVVLELRRATIKAIQSTGEEVQLAQVITPPSADVLLASTKEHTGRRPALPSTASSTPLLGLVGLMTLGGTFAVRAVASRIAH